MKAQSEISPRPVTAYGPALNIHLEDMPRLAAVLSLGVAILAMTYRGTWPTPAESLTLFISVFALYGALALSLHLLRAVCAGFWTLMLVSFGMPVSSRTVGADFQTFYDGARVLFDRHASPYQAPGATAFPFPTFQLIRLLSLGGRLSSDTTFLLFVMLQAVFLGIGFILSCRVIKREIGDHAPELAIQLIQAGLLVHPAILHAMGLGNSPVTAAVALICALWFWRCRTSRSSLHLSAISMNLGWMVKPQLLMATAFFPICWWLEHRRHLSDYSRAASIGRLVVSWAAGIIFASTLMPLPASLLAYRDFLSVAYTWHTHVAEVFTANYALPAILAKAMARLWGLPLSATLPFLTVGVALSVILWNFSSLIAGKPDTVRAFLPWLLGSLLWSSIMWHFYLGLVLGGLLLMVGFLPNNPSFRASFSMLLFCAGVGLTMIVSSFVYTLGILLLYFCCHQLRIQELQEKR
jgi:hypothetical protein